jgi:putative RecB family exonuclease
MSLVKHKRRRSASQLKQFRTCGEYFRLARIIRVPQQESAASAQGSAFHAAAERWERSGRTINPEVAYVHEYGVALTRLEERQPRERWRIWGRGSNVEADIENRLVRGSDQIRIYTDRMLESGILPCELPDGSLAVEVSFEMDIGPCIVVGSIDVLVDEMETYGRIKVRDLKTGTKEASPIQLAIYAMAARNVLGMDVWHGDFYYGKDGQFSDTYDLSRFTDEYIIREFEIMEDAIESRLLHPSPGSDCFTCPVKGYCKEIGNRTIE